MFIPALKQTIFTIRSKLLVYNRQHLFSKSHIYRSPLLAVHRSPDVKPVGKTLTQLVQIPLKNCLQRNIQCGGRLGKIPRHISKLFDQKPWFPALTLPRTTTSFSDHGSRSLNSKSLFCSARSGNMSSTGAMHSRFDRSAIAHESVVSAR